MYKNHNASFWRRFLAGHIDLAFTYLLLILGSSIESHSFASFIITYLSIALVIQAYPVISHYYFGQTIGKKIMGIKLTKESYLPINFKISLLRNSPEILITLLSIPGVVISLSQFSLEQIPFISLRLSDLLKSPNHFQQIAHFTIEFIKRDPFFNLKISLYAFFIYLEFFSVLLNDERLAIHDRLTRSRVIKL